MEHPPGQHPVCISPIQFLLVANHPSAPSAQYLGRKTLPIKRADAEPLTREDLQYDLLYYIFTDNTKAFVDYLAPEQPVVNFCDLYVNALYNSPKCSKVLKDKMVETPAFAIEFAKIALLTNVGRINTTMACESPSETSSTPALIRAPAYRSLPRDEDSFTELPPRAIPPEDGREFARCTPNQKLLKGCPLAFRVQNAPSVFSG